MFSLLFLVFFIELAVQLVNTVGAATINNLVCTLPSPLPSRLYMSSER